MHTVGPGWSRTLDEATLVEQGMVAAMKLQCSHYVDVATLSRPPPPKFSACIAN
jgi:hypothetical protein